MATSQQGDESPEGQGRRKSLDQPIQFAKLNRIVLVGKTGAGKSASGNTILGRTEFKVDFAAQSVTRQCDRCVETEMGVSVIDTPGLFDTQQPESSVITKIVGCIALSSPGPHVFLLVVPIGRFTEEDEMAIERIQNIFGVEAVKYTMILFTHGDELVDKTIKDFIQEAGPKLQTVMQLYENRFHVFNNKCMKNRKQASQLMDKVRTMVKENDGAWYTNDMYQQVERAIQRREDELRLEYEQKLKNIESKLEQANLALNLKDTDIREMTKQINDLKEQKDLLQINQKRFREIAEKKLDKNIIQRIIEKKYRNLPCATQ